MKSRLLLVEDDATTRLLVSRQLEKLGYEVKTAVDGKNALDVIHQINPDLVLLDVMMPGMNGFEVCEILKKDKTLKHIPVIIFTTLDSVEEKIKGFEVGADDYVPKTIHPKEMDARITTLIRITKRQVSLTAPETTGKLISFFSMRGGVGGSTLAVNTAAGLSQIWNGKTVLIDMVLEAGQGALMLNLSTRHSWDNLVDIPLDEFDESLINSLLLDHKSGLKLLAAPGVPDRVTLIHPEKVDYALKILKDNHEYVVLDLPHNFDERTLMALEMSDEIVLVITPEMASLRSANLVLKVFDKIGIPRERVQLVLNWTFEKGGLARKDMEGVLKQTFKAVIPFVPEPFTRGINLGIPVVFEDPESPLGAILEDLAYGFSKDQYKNQIPENPSAAWKRTNARLQRKQAND